ncbi:hypothetical protein CROQUDRAFT_98667 [Cronartium quercuum f. sp. fusiforme G11]|uniref:Uncharacterized protein n=1 Tax=Cronartium quercuum f. sp. fusiforme G11 TaxID=708437 RepID=A0A9P6N7V2_9BASI|nr:hypothetical protein CROQUDRAFT_98667 [Cronartium quercuum f. sp. fusiforme G11]
MAEIEVDETHQKPITFSLFMNDEMGWKLPDPAKFGTALENPFPPTSTTVPDSTNGLCHPSRAFGQAFNHLQPTRLLSTNLKPEPDRDKQTASFFSSPSISLASRIRSSSTLATLFLECC